jgi:hypothetical protein
MGNKPFHDFSRVLSHGCIKAPQNPNNCLGFLGSGVRTLSFKETISYPKDEIPRGERVSADFPFTTKGGDEGTGFL